MSSMVCYTCNKEIGLNTPGLTINYKLRENVRVLVCTSCLSLLGIQGAGEIIDGVPILPGETDVLLNSCHDGLNCLRCLVGLNGLTDYPVSLKRGIFSEHGDQSLSCHFEFAVYLCSSCKKWENEIWKKHRGRMEHLFALDTFAFHKEAKIITVPSTTKPAAIFQLVKVAKIVLNAFNNGQAILSSPPLNIKSNMMYLHSDKVGSEHWSCDGFSFPTPCTRTVKNKKSGLNDTEHLIKEINWSTVSNDRKISFHRRTLNSSELDDITLVEYSGDIKTSNRIPRTPECILIEDDDQNSNLQKEDEESQESVDLLQNERENRSDLSRSELSDNGANRITEEMISKAVKRAIEPMSYNVKQLKLQIGAQERKLNAVYQQNEAQSKQIKELKTELAKGPEELQVLLTGDGVIFLKKMCVRNLVITAKDDTETDMFSKFFEKAKDDGWMIKHSGKAEKDIISRFRDKRNYLKAQIRQRVHEDITNKTSTHAIKLEKTLKFLRDHIGIPELEPDMKQIIYTYAYVMVKYCNKNTNVDALDHNEKIIKKKVESNIWGNVMERIEADRDAKTDVSVIKNRLLRLLETGIEFKP